MTTTDQATDAEIIEFFQTTTFLYADDEDGDEVETIEDCRELLDALAENAVADPSELFRWHLEDHPDADRDEWWNGHLDALTDPDVAARRQEADALDLHRAATLLGTTMLAVMTRLHPEYVHPTGRA
jgi:hypothetical protein